MIKSQTSQSKPNSNQQGSNKLFISIRLEETKPNCTEERTSSKSN